MEDKEEVHPVVKLLLARMESHPEEFSGYISRDDMLEVPEGSNRWGVVLDTVDEFGSDADKAALAPAMRSIQLEEAHKRMMDELLHGESRRAEARRKEEEWHKQLVQSKYTQLAQAMAGSQSLPSAYQNALGTPQPGQTLPINNGGTDTTPCWVPCAGW